MTTSLEKSGLTLLNRDPKTPSSVPHGDTIKVILDANLRIAAHLHNFFVLTTATCLGEVAKFATVANKRNQLRALFVRRDVDPEWLPQMFELANLRTMRNTIVHSDFQVPWRVLLAWQAGAQKDLIADATAVGEELFVVSCEPDTYRVPFASVPALRKMPINQRSHFRLAGDGSYLHWPAQDIHLDLDSLLVAIDPERRARAEKVKRAYGQRYGEAIAGLRSEKGLRQSDISGLSEREVRRIERGGQATVDSLRKLAAAHNMKLSDYLNELGTRSHGSGEQLVADRVRLSGPTYHVKRK